MCHRWSDHLYCKTITNKCNNRCPAVRRRQFRRVIRRLTLQRWSILVLSSWFRLSACSKILHQSGHQGRGRRLKNRQNKQGYAYLDDSEFYLCNVFVSFAAMMPKWTTDQSLRLFFTHPFTRCCFVFQGKIEQNIKKRVATTCNLLKVHIKIKS